MNKPLTYKYKKGDTVYEKCNVGTVSHLVSAFSPRVPCYVVAWANGAVTHSLPRHLSTSKLYLMWWKLLRFIGCKIKRKVGLPLLVESEGALCDFSHGKKRKRK